MQKRRWWAEKLLSGEFRYSEEVLQVGVVGGQLMCHQEQCLEVEPNLAHPSRTFNRGREPWLPQPTEGQRPALSPAIHAPCQRGVVLSVPCHSLQGTSVKFPVRAP